jgi:signal transduction histidine kinase
MPDALPAVLARLVAAFGLRAALAFQPTAARPTVLAAHPRDAGDPDLLAKIGTLALAQRRAAAASGSPVQVPVKTGGRAGSALIAYSIPSEGQCRCALALIGDSANWDDEIRSTAHAVAGIVAAQIRHVNDIAEVAEIEQAQAELIDQTERLNCLIATAIPGVLISDQRGQITHISQSFGALFDIEGPDQLVGTPISATVRRIQAVFADPGEFVRRVREIFSARQPVSGEQITCADGRTYEGDYWPLIIDGHYRGEVWLIWDMSGRKALEKQRERLLEAELAARKSAELAQRQLAEQNEKLRTLDDAKTQFLSTVSHELRTPLTSIVSFSELIRGEADLLTPEGVHFLDIIERNAYRLLRLVSDLLLLSRLEAGALPLELAPVSIPALVTETVRSASVRALKLGVTVDAEAADGPPIDADHERLLQVLDNLVTNGVKFSQRDGLVHVMANRDGRGWHIDVADSGIGIPPGEIGNLFDRFVRATNARTAGLPGTGLGLSIVKAIVELHGGSVSVQSTLGRGTTVSVYLPGNK